MWLRVDVVVVAVCLLKVTQWNAVSAFDVCKTE